MENIYQNKTPAKKLGEYVLKLRKSKCLRGTDFHKEGITPPTLSRIENGKVDIKLSTIVTLAKIFYMTPQELIFNALSGNHIYKIRTLKNQPVHRWFYNQVSFSPDFVRSCIERNDLLPESIVLDVFAGCGTTSVEANNLGLKSISFDAHPFYAKIAEAKTLIDLDFNQIEQIFEDINNTVPNIELLTEYSDKAQTYLKKLVPEDNLAKMLPLTKLKYPNKEQQQISFLIINRLLELSSLDDSYGIYKRPSIKSKIHSISDVTNELFQTFQEDFKYIKKYNLRNFAKIHNISSEYANNYLEPNSVDLVITSPPYLNEFDYGEMSKFFLYYWHSIENNNDITQKYRLKLVKNSTTCLKDVPVNDYSKYKSIIPKDMHRELDYHVDNLKGAKKGNKGFKRYHLLIYPYFSQLYTIFSNVYYAMKPNAELNIEIADSALYYVHIPTQEHLAKMLELIGFRSLEVIQTKEKGHRHWRSRVGSVYRNIKLHDYIIKAVK